MCVTTKTNSDIWKYASWSKGLYGQETFYLSVSKLLNNASTSRFVFSDVWENVPNKIQEITW